MEQESLLLEQQDVFEQHPLASPQAASRTNFARKEDRRKFMVTRPVRTHVAGRLEKPLIKFGETQPDTVRWSTSYHATYLRVDSNRQASPVAENFWNLAVGRTISFVL